MANADFTPTKGAYTELKPFRFWCQKVLPLVYDDSLSYYELLCKVVDYLNKTMEDVDTLNTDVTNLFTAYDQLQDWVNAYYESADFEAAIDAGLDRMAESGQLTTLINAIITPQLPDIVDLLLPETVMTLLPDEVSSQIGGTVQTQLPGVVSNQIGPTVQTQLPGVVSNQIGGTVANQLPAVVSNQIGPVVEDKIVDPVEDWLETNMSGGIAVDRTLSIMGAGADAAFTGARLDTLDNVVGYDHVADTGSFITTANPFVFNYEVINDTGEFSDQGTHTYKMLVIPVNTGDKYCINAHKISIAGITENHFAVTYAFCAKHIGDPDTDTPYYLPTTYSADDTENLIVTAPEINIPTGQYYDETTGYLVVITADIQDPVYKVTDSVARESEITELKSDLDTNLIDYVQVVNPTNWYNTSGMKSGISKIDGTIAEDSSKAYSDYFIPVVPGDTVRLTRGDNFNSLYIYKVTAYDADKNVLSTKGMNSSNYTYTIPADVAYIKFTMTASNMQYYPMLTVSGDKPTSYVAYFEPHTVLTKNFLTSDANYVMQLLTNNNFSTKNLKNAYGCALPKTKFFQTVGLPETWYKKNMVTPPTDYIYCSVGNNYCSQSEKGVTFDNNTAVSSANGFNWAYYDVLLNLVEYTSGTGGYGWQRRIVEESLPNCSVLAVGDSTIDHDVLTASMLSYFAQKGKTLTLLGTLGSDGNYNEGRAGWKAADYFTDKKYQGITNPFYNPTTETFDFSYYMTNQGYNSVDYVVIQLGINDLYNSDASAIEPLWNNINGMIDSIKSYNSNIKVILNLPTTPNSDPSKHSVTEFLYRNIVIRYNEYAEKNALSKYGEASVRCSYCHLILDPDTDIRDNVHPTNEGYAKMAMEVINQINCWNAGV